MQFWKDALESIFDSSGKKALPQHPVILELKVNKYQLIFVYDM